MLERLLEAIEREERAVLLTVIEGAPLGAHVLVRRGWRAARRRRPGGGRRPGRRADPRAPQPDRRGRGGRRCSRRSTRQPPRLLIYGAVDTAEALCKAANLLGWRTIVADARQKFATRERIPSATELIVAWPEEALAQVAPDHATAVVVLTHDDKFDIPALQAALATEAFYIGALGSRRNQERRRERLAEAGVAEEAVRADLTARAASTSAPTPSPRRRSRSSPRSSPRGWAARAAR